MAYSEWPFQVQVLSEQEWTSYCSLLRWIQSFNWNKFNVKSQRDKIRTNYSQYVQPTFVFQQNCRFKDDTIVLTSASPIGECIRMILFSIDMADVAETKKVSYPWSGQSDAMLQLHTYCNKLANLMYDTNQDRLMENGVYTRSAFEAKFKLSWID